MKWADDQRIDRSRKNKKEFRRIDHIHQEQPGNLGIECILDLWWSTGSLWNHCKMANDNPFTVTRSRSPSGYRRGSRMFASLSLNRRIAIWYAKDPAYIHLHRSVQSCFSEWNHRIAQRCHAILELHFENHEIISNHLCLSSLDHNSIMWWSSQWTVSSGMQVWWQRQSVVGSDSIVIVPISKSGNRK
jgi:hypothetical protein